MSDRKVNYEEEVKKVYKHAYLTGTNLDGYIVYVPLVGYISRLSDSIVPYIKGESNYDSSQKAISAAWQSAYNNLVNSKTT